MGGGAQLLRALLARLIWIAVHPGLGSTGLPVGWFRGRRNTEVAVSCGPMIELVSNHVEKLLAGRAEVFHDWIRAQMRNDLHPFEKALVEADLERLADVFPRAISGSVRELLPVVTVERPA